MGAEDWQPQTQSSLWRCGMEVERTAFDPLGSRTSLGVRNLDVEHPTDYGGASWFALSFTSDRRRINLHYYSPGGKAMPQPGDADSRMQSGSTFFVDMAWNLVCIER